MVVFLKDEVTDPSSVVVSPEIPCSSLVLIVWLTIVYLHQSELGDGKMLTGFDY